MFKNQEIEIQMNRFKRIYVLNVPRSRVKKKKKHEKFLIEKEMTKWLEFRGGKNSNYLKNKYVQNV